MAYATGKVNAMVLNLHQTIEQLFKSITQGDVALSGKPLNDIQQLEANIQQVLTSASGTVDPFLLRNQVAAYDESKECDIYQNELESTLAWAVTMQVRSFNLAHVLHIRASINASRRSMDRVSSSDTLPFCCGLFMDEISHGTSFKQVYLTHGVVTNDAAQQIGCKRRLKLGHARQ
jgi:hypothetical protein